MKEEIGAAIVGIGLILLLGAAFVAARMPRAQHWVERIANFAEWLPIPNWLAFSGIQILVAAFGFLPASLLAVAAGATYGLWLGTLISAVGTMAGGWIAFLLARSILRPWVAKVIARFPASKRFDAAVATEGWRFVMLMRVSPVMPFAATSYGLGLTSIPQRDYLIGTLASLPALVGYVALGAIGRASWMTGQGNGGALHIILPVLGVIAVVIAVLRLRSLASRTGLTDAA